MQKNQIVGVGWPMHNKLNCFPWLAHTNTPKVKKRGGGGESDFTFLPFVFTPPSTFPSFPDSPFIPWVGDDELWHDLLQWQHLLGRCSCDMRELLWRVWRLERERTWRRWWASCKQHKVPTLYMTPMINPFSGSIPLNSSIAFSCISIII